METVHNWNPKRVTLTESEGNLALSKMVELWHICMSDEWDRVRDAKHRRTIESMGRIEKFLVANGAITLVANLTYRWNGRFTRFVYLANSEPVVNRSNLS